MPRGVKREGLKTPAVKTKAPPTISDAHKFAVEEYFRNGYNKKKALEAAGFVENTVLKKGAELVWNRPEVREYMEACRKKLQERFDLSKERIAAELAKMAFANLGDLITVQEDGSAILDFSSMEEHHRAAIAEFTTETYMEGRGDEAVPVKKNKVKFHDKKGALESLAKLLGYVTEKKEVHVEVSIVERLQAGRMRLRQAPVIDIEATEVEGGE